MPRSTKAEIRASLERIEAILREFPDGMRRVEIKLALEARHGEDIPARTLRRRLEQLKSAGRIVHRGKSHATRYVATGGADGTPPRTGDGSDGEESADTQGEGDTDDVIGLSPQGIEVQRWVRLPRLQRQPCTYRRVFLEDYVPGETWYLEETTRDELLAIGEPPDPERPAGTYARAILDRLLIDLSWASSRLEGNTYSRLDTQNLIENGIHAEGKSQQEAQMILNHRAAIRMLVDSAEEIGFDRRTLLGLHAALAENLVTNSREEGVLRQRPVEISGTVYRPIAIPQVIRECFDLLIEKARDIPDPFEQAFFAMVHIPYLQPFIDVNKRTSRIAANIPFIKGNLCPLSFVDVPQQTYVEATIGVYERQEIDLLRDLFVWAYRRSAGQYRIVREALGEPDAVRFRYRDELADLVRETVRARTPVRRSRLRAWAQEVGIEAGDQEAFVDRAMDILLNLTDGVARRCGLSAREVEEWREAFPASETPAGSD